MKGLGVRDEVLLEAGLTRKKEEDRSVVPRFRGRLLFPIHDLRGRVVAFGGRILGEGEPKYLNSPDTPIFHKGKLLYHLDVAKHAMRKTERAILVEGYFDVLRLALAGIEEVVAPMGTGLSADQGSLLRRYTAHVILLYDSDEAGLRATFRAGDELLRHGLRVSVATLPEGEDPDTLVQRHGGAARLLRVAPGAATRPRPPAADHPCRGRPDHARAVPHPRGGSGERAERCPGARDRGRGRRDAGCGNRPHPSPTLHLSSLASHQR